MSRYLGSVIVGVAMLVWGIGAHAAGRETWVGDESGVRATDARGLVSIGGTRYLASKNEVYEAGRKGDAWRSIFTLPASGDEIGCIGGGPSVVAIGTMSGIYACEPGGAWRSVYRGADPDRNRVLSLAAAIPDGRTFVAGTGSGVIMSRDGMKTWVDIGGPLANRQVGEVVVFRGGWYACADDGLYRSRGLSSSAEPATMEWTRVFASGGSEEKPEEPADDEPEESEAHRRVACVAAGPDRLYIGVGESVLFSADGGDTWNAFCGSGLSGELQSLLVSKDGSRIFCGTAKGVFEYAATSADSEGVWRELYTGLTRQIAPRRLAWADRSERFLWAVGANGVFRLEEGRYLAVPGGDPLGEMQRVRAIFAGEPSLRELSRAAMDVAEVGPEKVKNWRAQARLKALVPKVSLSADHDRGNSAEIYTSATKSFIYEGPDDISDGWSASVSWELGDLIWSTDQTSIDTRSRLTTQLRNDILADLRRAYYERRRLQYELATTPPVTVKGLIEKELRMQELAQTIDDLTGNYLSDRMKNA